MLCVVCYEGEAGEVRGEGRWWGGEGKVRGGGGGRGEGVRGR